MNKKLLMFFIIILSVCISAQRKSDYDITPKAPANGYEVNAAEAADNTIWQNEKYSITLIQGGYFTIGTTNGASQSKLDDNCQITFGHPYAKTSFPLLSIDGAWFKAEDYFNSAEMIYAKDGDSLKMTANKAGKIFFSFMLYYSREDQTIKIRKTVKNLDTKGHNIGMALFIDPALGKYGDGRLEYKGAYLDESKIFSPTEMPSVFSIWEKSEGAKGIGMEVLFDKQPAKLIAGNWNSLSQNNEPESILLPETIYDLYLKYYWAESNLSLGQEKSITTTIGLKTPDFAKDLILRWDIPQFVAIDNNILFPQNLSTYIQINKNGNPSYSSAALKILPGSQLTISQADFSYGSAIPDNQRVNIKPEILYEPGTPEIVVKLLNGTTVIDELHRKIFIPATPVSDTGIAVKIDSLITNRLPNVNMIIEAEVAASKIKITSLAKGNIFLYEDMDRISNFNFIKDTSGGIQAADIIFVLDVTGSMGGQIEAVKKNIIEFSDSMKIQGVDYQLGLVTFLDAIENIYPFTKEVATFQQWISDQYAHGGGDGPENSLQGLLEASKYNFRPNAKRIVIWITDSNYHEADSFTPLIKKQVIDSLLIKGIVVNAIGMETFKSSYYDPILLATGGNYYNIQGNFRDILLDISRMKAAYKYLLSYTSPSTSTGKRTINLKVRWAGLGGETFIDYGNGTNKPSEKHFSFFPNPFNPEITFHVNKGNYESAKIKIFNLLGQQVKEYTFDAGSIKSFMWNAKNESGCNLSSGIYFVTLTLTAPGMTSYLESAKILYLK